MGTLLERTEGGLFELSWHAQDYIMIDAVAVLSLGYSMTLSHPAK